MFSARRRRLKARRKEIKTNRLWPGFRESRPRGGRRRGVILNICKVFILHWKGSSNSSSPLSEGEGRVGTLEHP